MNRILTRKWKEQAKFWSHKKSDVSGSLAGSGRTQKEVPTIEDYGCLLYSTHYELCRETYEVKNRRHNQFLFLKEMFSGVWQNIATGNKQRIV